MKRNTIILLVLVVVLWGVWYLFSTGEKSELAVRQHLDFFKADSLEVDSIAVKYGSWSHMAKRDGRWKVIFPDWSSDADPIVLRDVFKFTNEMVLENLISTRPEKQGSFQVDTLRGTVMQFFTRGSLDAAFVMGKPGADMAHTYIRRAGSDSVYLARGEFQKVFKRVPSDWTSRTLFDIDTTMLSAIRWITPEADIRATRGSDGAWLVSKNAGPGLPVDTSIFNVRLRRMAPLRADAIALEGTGGAAAIDNPAAQLILETTDGRADTLLWNPPGEDQSRIFAFRPGRPKPLFIFYKGSYDRLSGNFSDLVMKPMPQSTGSSLD